MRFSSAAIVFSLTAASLLVDGVAATPRSTKVKQPSAGNRNRAVKRRDTTLPATQGKTFRRDDSTGLTDAFNALIGVATTFNNTDPDIFNVVTQLGVISGSLNLVKNGDATSGSSLFSDLSAQVSVAETSISTSLQNIQNQVSQVNNLISQATTAIPALANPPCDGSSSNPCPYSSWM